MPEHPVLTAAARFRAQVLSREREAANRLVQTYGRAYTKMGTSIEALIKQVGSLKDPDRADVVRMAALRSLQSQVVSELNTFSAYADTEISRAATAAIQSGLLDSRALSVAAMGGTGPGARALAAGWDMLPTESVETMLGFLADDSPLHTTLVKKLGPAVAQKMGDALVDGIALGMNPRKVAEIVRRELGVGLTWALTTARTAQINAYREAARANYVANSHIVGGWTWLSALGDRTCMSCLNMHGSFHPVTESLNDHHAGRCVPIPYVKQAAAFGLPQPEIEPGEQWFNRQPEAFQRERLGPGRFDAWKAGKFDFRDLSVPYRDPVYGEMLREATLKGLLTGKAKGKTLTFGTPAPERVEAGTGAPLPEVVTQENTLRTIENEIRKQNYESAAVVDANGNVIFRKDGEAASVKFTDEEVAKMAGNVLTHNHPSGTSFSFPDLQILSQRRLQSIRAVGTNFEGKLVEYEMEVLNASYYSLDMNLLESVYRHVAALANGAVGPEFAAKKITAEAASDMFSHFAAQKFASESGGLLKYTRKVLN